MTGGGSLEGGRVRIKERLSFTSWESVGVCAADEGQSRVAQKVRRRRGIAKITLIRHSSVSHRQHLPQALGIGRR